MSPQDGESVPDDHEVLRLPTPPPSFVPNSYVPQWRDIDPSSEEKQRTPIRVSVWDARFTTADQARTLRRRSDVLVLQGRVADVRAAGASAVVYETLTEPDRSQPGADGHAGMEGLIKLDAETKAQRLDRLGRIARCFRLISY